MARTADNDYFKMFIELGGYSEKTAKTLRDFLRQFNRDQLVKKMEELHVIENAADMRKHFVMEKLSKEFLPPIEREDIVRMISNIDDITDSVEDVLIKIYMFHIQSIKSSALEFADIIVQCCEQLMSALAEFHNFKKSEIIKKHIIEINRLEGTADRLYMQAIHSLYGSGANPEELAAWGAVYNQMEKCCDACEHTADILEEVIMKNT